MIKCLIHIPLYIMVLLLFFTCTHTQDTDCLNSCPETNSSCFALRDNINELSVKHCTFHEYNYTNKGFPKLLCNVTIQVTHTNTEIVVVNSSLIVSLSMEAIFELHNATMLCMGVTSMSVLKTQSPVNVWHVMKDSDIVWYLTGVSELSLTVNFRDPVPVGLLQVQDVQCWEKGWSLSCIHNIHLSTILISKCIKNWDKLSFLDSLLGQVPKLKIVFNAFSQLSSEWFLSNFTGLGLQQLTLNNGNLATHLPLSQQDLLVHLDLFNNEIARIPKDTFFLIPNLEHLNLANNKLVRIPNGISTLSKLRILDLSGNLFYVTSSDRIFITPLKALNNLNILSISHTMIHSLSILQPLLLTSSVKLLELYLKDCSISIITQEDINLFHDQIHLSLLDLSSNYIQQITSDFSQLPQNIQILNFSSNGLSKSPQLKFRDDYVLNKLDLSNNKLTKPNVIESGTVYDLDLSGNNIANWSAVEFLPPLVHVEYLNLSYNFIKSLNADMLKTLHPIANNLLQKRINIVTWIDLGGNLFDCKDCNILPLKEYLLDKSNHNILNLNSKSSLTCNQYNISLQDLNLEDCLAESTYKIILTIIPLAFLCALVLLFVVVVYVYNFEITYLLRLVKMKRRRTTQEEYIYDAFVCYSGSDRAWVISVLLPRLENGQEKYKLCLHERDFILGSFITHNIVNSMQQSRKTVVILTTNFVHSQWCNWELEMAKHKLFEDGKNFLILLELERLGRANLPRHLRYFMETRTYLEWPTDKHEEHTAWKRLMEALGVSLYQLQSTHLYD